MRILVSASVILLASAIALPSAACDRHGAGGFYGQFNGASWSDYSPPLSETLSFGSDNEELSEWEKFNVVPPAAKSKKPSFSKASTRASDAAKSRIAALAQLKAIEKKSKEAAADSESASASALLNAGR